MNLLRLEGTCASGCLGVPVSLEGDPSYSQSGVDVMVSSPMILSLLEHLVVQLSMGVVGLCTELVLRALA